MGCEECTRLWKIYEHRRTIHMKLLEGAKWGAANLKDALERANREREDIRLQLLQHSATHETRGEWFNGPVEIATPKPAAPAAAPLKRCAKHNAC